MPELLPPIRQRIAEATAALLGRSAYARPAGEHYAYGADDIDNERVVSMRRMRGGQIQQQPFSQVRWYLAELERAEHAADGGIMAPAARVMRAARRDGVLSGLLSTRTDGLVRLPKKFVGDPDVVAALELGHNRARSCFDEMFPPSELALLASDGITLGVGVAELVPVAGRDYPVCMRLDPEYLVYRWADNQWLFQSISGLLPITPGDGRWLLHTPGGHMSPWQHAQWRALARAFIRKEHAALHKDAWESKLAHPARVAVSPAGAGEAQTEAWFRSVLAWGVNTVFGMRPGYDVKLVESNGRGWESFNQTIRDQNDEFKMAIAGQLVTSDGGAGFQNSDIHKSIRADLIKGTADALAYTINTQGMPVFIAQRFGIEAIDSRATVIEWDVTPPEDRNAEGLAMVTAANGIKLLAESLAPSGLTLDVQAMCQRFSIPLVEDVNNDGLAELASDVDVDADIADADFEQLGDDAAGDVDAPKPPALRLVPPSDDDATDGGESVDAEKPADTALNGAQIASLVAIIQAVNDGTLPRDSALEIIQMTFQVDLAKAEKLLGPPQPQPTAAPQESAA